jgi:CDP-diacylglycerol--glycerol-3-phosphate 3-phosphatidyltransferase
MDKISKLIPNTLTISRVVMTLMLNYCIFEHFMYGQGSAVVLAILFSGICLSDLFDGKLARKLGVTSVMGAKLDVFADLLYIVSSYMMLIVVKVLPAWYLAFVCIKFLEFVATSNFIKRYDTSSKHPFVFDKIGRIVSATFFLIPGVACLLSHSNVAGSSYLINGLLYTTFLGGAYSSFERIRGCYMLTKLRYSKVRR